MVAKVMLLTSIMGFLGLAIDIGLLNRTKQEAQIAADAAAIAAALKGEKLRPMFQKASRLR
jgi:uncharacterized membrane protein